MYRHQNQLSHLDSEDEDFNPSSDPELNDSEPQSATDSATDSDLDTETESPIGIVGQSLLCPPEIKPLAGLVASESLADIEDNVIHMSRSIIGW